MNLFINFIKSITMNFVFLNKYPEVDQFRMRPRILLFSLLASVFIVFMVINVTTSERKISFDFDIGKSTEIETITPITKQDLPKKLPSINIKLHAVEAVIHNDTTAQLLNSEINVDDKIVKPEFVYANENSNPMSTKEDPYIEASPLIMSEEMPRFPGCEHLDTKAEKEECANKKLLEFIHQNLRYPELAVETRIEGRVTIRFVVSETGNIENAEVLRDIGAGCGAEAVRTVLTMNNMDAKWTPGRQSGRKRKVYYILPVVFKLN